MDSLKLAVLDLHQLAEETMLRIDQTYAFVDQAAHIEQALKQVAGEAGPALQHRVLYEELLPIVGWIGSSGRVYSSFENAQFEANARNEMPRIRGAHVETRIKSQEAWPRPWDNYDVELLNQFNMPGSPHINDMFTAAWNQVYCKDNRGIQFEFNGYTVKIERNNG